MRQPKRDYYEVLGVPHTADDEQISRAPSLLGEVELEQFEAARGVRREVRIVDAVDCRICDGSGAAPGTEIRICDRCLGKGTVRVSSGLGVGRWLQVEPCPECGGDGRFQTRCSDCGGLGEVATERTIKVRIPPGVEDRTSLRVSDESENAYLIVRVKPAPKDSRLAQVAAVTLLLCAVALLVYFLVWV